MPTFTPPMYDDASRHQRTWATSPAGAAQNRAAARRGAPLVVTLLVAALLLVAAGPAAADRGSQQPGQVTDGAAIDTTASSAAFEPASTSVAPASIPLEVPRPRTGIERGMEAQAYADHVTARINPGAFGFPELAPMPALPWSEEAAEVARRWSDIMAAGPLPGSYEHSTEEWRRIQLQLRDPRILTSGENILWAERHTPEWVAETATLEWMRSEGHRRNIMFGTYDAVGIGASVGPGGTIMMTTIFIVESWGPPLTAPQLTTAVPRPLDGICAGHPPAGFHDIADRQVARAVDCLVALGVVRGIDDERYAPDARLSRQQLATIMAGAYELAGGTLPAPGSGPRFSDVPDGSVHGANIRRLAAAGMVAGRSDGSFAPRENVQRRHVASISVAGYERLTSATLPYPMVTHITDSSSLLFNAPVQVTADRGWDVGVNGRFRPTAAITRGEMALLVARWLEDLDQAG